MADNLPQSANPTSNQDNPENRSKPQPDRLYAGKYREVGELEKGYQELFGEGLKQREGRIRAEAERDALRAQLQAAKAAEPDPLREKLADSDIPLDALNARVRAEAFGAVQEALKPLFQAQQAEHQVRTEHPDFPGAAELQRALGPEVAEAYQKLLGSDPEAAMRLGYQAWKTSHPKTEVVSPEQRQTAGMPRKQTSGPSDADNDRSQERYRELLANAVGTGDWTNFIRYRFGDAPWYKRIAEGRDEW